jgi:hypothetical protein
MKDEEVVLEAPGNAMAVVRVLSPYVARVIMANPLQVKAIAHAHVKTDKIAAGVLASLHAAGFYEGEGDDRAHARGANRAIDGYPTRAAAAGRTIERARSPLTRRAGQGSGWRASDADDDPTT